MKAITVLAVSFLLLAASVALSPAANTETCTYSTNWGPLVMHFNYTTNIVRGSYEHKGGQLSGILKPNDVITGTWSQPNGSGNFSFSHGTYGFTGKWNNSGESYWQGDWNGKVIQCVQ